MKKLLTLVAVALLAWLVIQFPRIMLNPGELAEDHQDIRDKCTECHDPFWGISSDKCIKCHALDEIGADDIGTSVAFHAKLNNVECISCHTEHKGIHPNIATMTFNHDMLGAEMKSNCQECHSNPTDTLHSLVSSECSSCHSTSGWKESGTFDHSMLLNLASINCSSCHTAPRDTYHQSFTGKCSECHSTTQWVPSTFDHSSYFVFDNHHNVQCSTCHTGNDYTSYTCYGCHEHSESNIREEHQEEGIYNFSNCASCHHSGNEDDAEHYNGNNSDKGNTGDEVQQFLDKQNKEGHKSDEGDDDD